MPRKDPIIEEIHAVRDAIAREAGYDLDKMLEAARARQKASGRQAVRLSPREAEPVEKASLVAEGTPMVALAPESSEPIQLSLAEERELLQAMEDIRGGDYVDGEERNHQTGRA